MRYDEYSLPCLVLKDCLSKPVLDTFKITLSIRFKQNTTDYTLKQMRTQHFHLAAGYLYCNCVQTTYILQSNYAEKWIVAYMYLRILYTKGWKLLQNFISCWGAHVVIKGTKTWQEWSYARRLSYYRMMAEIERQEDYPISAVHTAGVGWPFAFFNPALFF